VTDVEKGNFTTVLAQKKSEHFAMEAFSMNEFGEREKIEFYRYKTDTTEF